MLLKDIQYEGQLKIMNAKVAVIGAGGIGCPLSLYIAAAGVGTIGLFDSDVVDLTNLHRQVGHTTGRIGTSKTQSLKKTLLNINPTLKINEHPAIDIGTVKYLDEYDYVVDGSDNPQCRYFVNDYCMKTSKKLLSGACIGWEGQITCYGNGSQQTSNPCYRCLWGDDQVTTGGCSTLGVIGMVPGIVGEVLGIELLKLIVNSRSSLEGHLLTFDAKSMNFRKMKIRNKKAECIACGQKPMDMLKYDYTKYTTCKAPSKLPEVPSMSWQEYMDKSKKGETTPKIIDVRPTAQYNIINFSDSVSLPFDQMKNLSAEELKQHLIEGNEKVIGVSCQRGIMSKFGTEYLISKGFNAVNIEGGLDGYGRSYDPRIVQL